MLKATAVRGWRNVLGMLDDVDMHDLWRIHPFLRDEIRQRIGLARVRVWSVPNETALAVYARPSSPGLERTGCETLGEGRAIVSFRRCG
jgi:hypothetical protein